VTSALLGREHAAPTLTPNAIADAFSVAVQLAGVLGRATIRMTDRRGLPSGGWL